MGACAGTIAPNASWPGLSATQDTAYLTNGSYVFAIDLQGGTQRWHYPDKVQTGVFFFADPALTADQRLVVGGYDKSEYLLDAKTGQLVWKSPPSKEPIVAPALVADGVIYAASGNGTLYALDPKDGSARWTFSATRGSGTSRRATAARCTSPRSTTTSMRSPPPVAS